MVRHRSSKVTSAFKSFFMITGTNLAAKGSVCTSSNAKAEFGRMCYQPQSRAGRPQVP